MIDIMIMIVIVIDVMIDLSMHHARSQCRLASICAVGFDVDDDHPVGFDVDDNHPVARSGINDSS